jgi:DUF4097 and DUF4098 domain-containing protein YvlB
VKLVAAVIFTLAAQMSLLAKCPVSGPVTVVVRAPMGNLQIDTTGRDSVEAQINNSLLQLQETCGRDSIELTSNSPDSNQIQGTVNWRIVVPKNANLDLVTMSGSINVGDSDGNAVLRTTGGSVMAGQIKGNAAIITQAGSIKAGNIGGNAELRSQGGSLEVGDVAGDAEFQTAVGPIRAGGISGRLIADTAGGMIVIREVRGDAKATTRAGDISIGDGARINATTAGGNITSRRARGPFQGHTESGDIRIDSAAGWVEASTGFGNIVVRMAPDNLDGDLHVNLQSGVGDVTIFLPQRMKASVEATVERPAFSAQRIISDFPMNSGAANAPRGLVPNKFYAPTQSQTVINGGGNRIVLHTSLGKIEIKKQ